MATTKETTGDSAEDDGTSLGQLFLNESGPLGIGIESSTTTVGTGLLDHLHGLLIIAEELECIGNQAYAVNINATATSSTGTILHVLGLTDVAHQCGNGIGLLGRVARGVSITHVGPVKGDRRQSSHVHIGT